MPNNPPDFETDADARRREFLKRAMVLSGGAGLLTLPAWSRNALAAIDQRAYAGSQFALELDGQFADYLKSFEGGIAHSEVIEASVGAQTNVNKHIGQPKFDEFLVQVGSTSGPLIQWVANLLEGRLQARNGAIMMLDQNFAERRRINFTGALPTELAIPALDAAGSREPGYLGIKFQPARTSMPVAKGGSARVGGPGRQEKAWMKSNFQLKIAGLEQACAFVTRIEPLTVRQKFAVSTVGEVRIQESVPTKLEYSNLVIHVPEHQADPFYKWLDEFVVRGDSGDAKEKTGSLEFIGQNGRDVLMRFNFFNIGMLGCRLLSRSVERDGAAQVRVEMYVERMSMDTTLAKGADAPAKREVGGSGSVGMDVLKGFNQ